MLKFLLHIKPFLWCFLYMSRRPLMGSSTISLVKNLCRWPMKGKQMPGLGSLVHSKLLEMNLTSASTITVELVVTSSILMIFTSWRCVGWVCTSLCLRVETTSVETRHLSGFGPQDKRTASQNKKFFRQKISQTILHEDFLLSHQQLSQKQSKIQLDLIICHILHKNSAAYPHSPWVELKRVGDNI